MNSIFLWVIQVIFESLCSSNWEKALNSSNIPKSIFKTFSHFIWFFMVLIFIYIFWIDMNIFSNHLDILIIFWLVVLWTFSWMFDMEAYKHIKLSEWLPYANFDKILVIIIWFIYYYWTVNETSIITLTTSIIAIFIILFFTIDVRKISLPNKIWTLLLAKVFNALKVLWVWYILIKYSSITFLSFNLMIEMIIFIFISIVLWNSFKLMLTQSKPFYINRFTWTALGWLSYIILYDYT